jgi:hypothetical protein
MSPSSTPAYAVFEGHRLLASGPLLGVALAFKRASKAEAAGPLLIFDDSTGRSIDIDVRGTDKEVASRLGVHAGSDGQPKAGQSSHPNPDAAEHPNATDANVADVPAAGEPRGRGRPRLGVVAREVTLLPRHWEWLSAQPGGASVALRKLVEVARREHGEKDQRRAAHERAYHFMSAIAGDLPGFEEATRALFADDRPRFEECVTSWPNDVRAYATRLAFDDVR